MATEEGRSSSPPDNRDRKLGGKKLIATVVLGAGAVGLWTYQSLGNDKNMSITIQEQVEEDYQEAMAERGYDTSGNPIGTANDDPGSHEPRKNEEGMELIAVQYPTTITAQGEMRDMLSEYNKFEENRRATLDSLIAGRNLSAEQLSFLEENLASMASKTDKSAYTDNEVLAALSLDLALTSRQGASYGYGADMLPMIFSRSNVDYPSVANTITRHDSDDAVLVSVWRQNGEPYERPKNHYFQGDDFGQVKDARVIVRNKIRGIGQEGTPLETVVTVFVLNDDGNGNQMWQQFKNYDADDANVEAELLALHPQR